ncbi:MAG: DUF4363 family protein [Clostridiales bacterium]|nr:DUF4363 family protein [Clostridiales bacterium]
MRNLLIILLFLAIFIAGSVFWEHYLNNEFVEILDDIESAQSIEQIDNLAEKWEKISDKAGILINHNELEEVSQHLWAMKAEKNADYDEFLESKQVVVNMIKHIQTMNSLHILNIF